MIESETSQGTSVSPSLYQKLGGASGIASLVDDIVAAHLENPVIKARFLPYLEDMEKVSIIKRHFCEFLGMGCGGPEVYSGRDMVSVHRGMNISDAEFVAVLDDILMVSDKHKIDEQTKKELLYMAYSVKKEVVNV